MTKVLHLQKAFGRLIEKKLIGPDVVHSLITGRQMKQIKGLELILGTDLAFGSDCDWNYQYAVQDLCASEGGHHSPQKLT